jgi:hypothetical protein
VRIRPVATLAVRRYVLSGRDNSMDTRKGCRLAVVALIVLVCAGLAAPAFAQAIRGTLLGTVSDQSGAAMPGVTVVITETRTNVSRETVTNETGNYTFPNLQEGVYNVKAELSGFKTTLREGVRVAVNNSVRVDLQLSVGALEETVTVSGEVPLLQTDRTDTGRTLESVQVAAMPLGFNRNFQGMLATVPGASRPYKPHSEFFNSQDSLSTEVNGQSRMANNVLIEGLDNNQRTGLLTLLIPPAEAIDTVSVTTSNYDAEFGRAAGAVTNVTLKSGTNSLKGSIFWFGNTEATSSLPASTYFSTSTRTKAPTTYNQFGFTVGGPIKKDRLFFFGDFQRTQDELGTSYLFVVPTAAFRNGDFSAAPTTVYDPTTGDASGNGRQAFAGNQIPSARISPIAKAILAKLPLPNVTGAALGVGNYQVNSSRTKNTNSFDAKVNYALNDSNALSVRFSYQKPEITQLPPDGYDIWGGPLGGGFMATGTNMTYSTAANWTHTFSPTFIAEVRGGTSYYHNEAKTTAAGQTLAQQLGIPGINLDEWSSGPPTITINNGFSNPVLGYVNSLPWDRWERTYETAVTLTKVQGNHTIKFGGNYRHNADLLLQTQDNQGPRGGYTFSGAQTGATENTAANSGIANSFASFLLDLPSGMARDLKVSEKVGTRHWAVYLFAHDKWQVSKRVTLDLGLRWEYYDPLIGLGGKGSLSNYDPVNNLLLVSGYGDIKDDFGVKKDFNNFAPRLGASYRINDKTVLRGGFGASTTPFPDNRYAFNYPVKQNNSYQPANSYSAAGAMAAGFPAPTYLAIPSDGKVNANNVLSSSLFYVPNDLQQGVLYSWNVAFQRELVWGLTGEVAYVGNRSDDVLNRFPLNAGMVLGAGNAGRPLYKYGKTAGVENLAWKGKTRYNGLQMKLDRRFRGGWLVTNSYTFSRARDYANDNGGPSTPIEPERSWGYGNFDRTHVFVSSFVWSLPWFKNPDSKVLHYVLGSWQLSGIYTYQSGQPLDITMSNASLNTPDNTQRPNSTGDAKILDQYGPGKTYFDTSVFSAPSANTFGSRTRNMGDVRGPRFTNLDFSLVKQVSLGGTRMLEARADVWNLPNTIHMSNPNTTYGGSTFGQITSAYNERSMRFSVRVLF